MQIRNTDPQKYTLSTPNFFSGASLHKISLCNGLLSIPSTRTIEDGFGTELSVPTQQRCEY